MERLTKRSEGNIQSEILIGMSKAGATVFRCNTGQGWTGKVTKRYQQNGHSYIVIEDPRPLHAGLVKGGSDIIGWDKSGLFTAVEVKNSTGRATEDQVRFIEAVRSKGGRAGVARSVEDALRILEG